MDTNILLLIIAFWVISAVIGAIYILNKKKKDVIKRREANERNKSLYNNPNIAKVAIWINLELVNGKPFDESIIYYSKVKSNMTGLLESIDVALMQPGEYTLVVHSREYSNVVLNVVIEPGQVYQLGADANGPYFIQETDLNRYQLTEY